MQKRELGKSNLEEAPGVALVRRASQAGSGAMTAAGSPYIEAMRELMLGLLQRGFYVDGFAEV
jgi:hypothetical protein